ncbi:hypothetical protein B9Z55_021816 [Caenorhabditis nigoni]|uniref:Uncharacterized protein n=1 Tax=Caenorhabditis nigoni TaxID=1611254 RepID=A0A2G5TTR0_9PELO|nr:hypothetical protein B9Z55_021816 [Caenorhabditis nigoni]
MKEEPTSSSSSGHIEKSQNEPAEHMERKVSRFDKIEQPAIITTEPDQSSDEKDKDKEYRVVGMKRKKATKG